MRKVKTIYLPEVYFSPPAFSKMSRARTAAAEPSGSFFNALRAKKAACRAFPVAALYSAKA